MSSFGGHYRYLIKTSILRKCSVPSKAFFGNNLQFLKSDIVMDGRDMDKDQALSIMGLRADALQGKPDKIHEILDKALFDRTQQMMHGTASIKKPKYLFSYKIP